MKKKIGKGSWSLLLCLLALLWGSNIGWLNNFCLGDFVLGLFGIPAWSNGTGGVHYTVFGTLILLIPAFFIGLQWKDDLFATAGKYISGIIGGCLIVMAVTMMIF